MALTQFTNSAPTSGSSFDGFKTFSNPRGQGLTVEELLVLARAQGGAVAEVAEELSNPRRSILATAGQGFKDAFVGFIDLVGTPLNVVAGAVSPDYTIKQAMDQNLQMSDVLLGQKELANRTAMSTSGQFVTRLAVDIFFDPLTYVTFGASRGLIGLGGLRKITANQKFAQTAADLFSASDSVLGEMVTKNLVKAGKEVTEESVAAGIRSTRSGLAQVKGIEEGGSMALTPTAEKLLNKITDNQRQGLLKSATDKDIREAVVKNAKDAGIKLTPEQIAAKVTSFRTGAEAALINAVFKDKVSPEFALGALNNLMANNPALISTFLDKGGVKLFSKTILSGQRIKSTIGLIPGFSHLDSFTKPFRDMTMALFDTSRTKHGKLSDKFIALRQRAKDVSTSLQDQALSDVLVIGKRLKLSEPEIDLVLAALEGRRIPADPRMAELWKALNGYDFNTNIVREEVFQGTRMMQSLRKKHLKTLRDSGVRVHEAVDSVGHHLVTTPLKNIPNRLTIGTKTAKAQRMAQVSAFEEVIPLTKAETVAARFPDADTYVKVMQDKAAKAGKTLTEENIAKLRTVYEGAKRPDRIVGFANKMENGLDVNILKKGETVGKLNLERVETADLTDEIFVDKETQKQYKRVRSYIEEAQDNGFKFENNIFKIAALDSLDVIKTTVQNDFTRDVASKFGLVASEAPAGYVAVNIKGLKGETSSFANFVQSKTGEEILFHPSVAQGIEDLMSFIAKDTPSQMVLKAFDNVQNLWKASVTSIWPAFHGRNAISNVFLNYLDIGVNALDPTLHVQATKLMVFEQQFGKLHADIALGGKAGAEASQKLYELQNRVFFTDGTGMNWTYGELRRTVKDNVVAFNSNISGQVDVTKGAAQMAQDIGDNLLFPVSYKPTLKNTGKLLNKPFEVGRAVGSVIEDQARLVSFFANLKKTGDVGFAAQRTKQFLFDYQNLTSFEKNFMRRMIPFYTFTKKNLGNQVKTLLTNPGKISQQIRTIQTLGDVISDETLTPEERSVLPKWLQDSFVVLKTKKNNQVEVFGGLGTPLEAAFAVLKPNQVLGSMSPVARIPLELASGFSFFSGKAISEVTNAAAFTNAPDVLKDFIGFTEVPGTRKDGSTYKYFVSLRPERMHLLLNLPPTSRVFSSLKQMNAVDVSEGGKILQLLTGFKSQSFDLEVEAERREKELRSQIENILEDAQVGYRLNRFVIPKDKNFGGF